MSDSVENRAPEGQADGFDQCVPSDFTDAVQQLAGVESLVRSQLVAVIRAVDVRDGWEGDATDLAHWVSLHADVGRATATQLVEVARSLDDLPHIAQAFSAGRLGWDRGPTRRGVRRRRL